MRDQLQAPKPGGLAEDQAMALVNEAERATRARGSVRFSTATR